MMEIQIGSFNIILKKAHMPPHRYFAFYNLNSEGKKAFGNNILEQGFHTKYIHITRKRQFKDVKNIVNFLTRSKMRIGNWK